MLLQEIIPTALQTSVLQHKPASFKILLKVTAGKRTIKKESCHPNGVSTHLNQLTILQRATI
jgi:hypothetical protein